MHSFTKGNCQFIRPIGSLLIHYLSKLQLPLSHISKNVTYSSRWNPSLPTTVKPLPALFFGMATSIPQPPKPSFASILLNESPIKFAIDDLPMPFVMDDVVSIQILEEPFLHGLDHCKTNLVGRLLLPSKAQPLKAHQLCACWPNLEPWIMAPLGKGFFML